jgi:hypothetical protein
MNALQGVTTLLDYAYSTYCNYLTLPRANFPCTESSLTLCRVVTWGTLMSQSSCYTALLKPFNMPENHPELVELCLVLEHFTTKPTVNAWPAVRNKFLRYVKNNWSMRPYFIRYFSVYCENQSRYYNSRCFANFQHHMEMLFDNTIHLSQPEIWIVQMAHAKLIEDSNMEIMKALAPRTAVIEASVLEADTVYFLEQDAPKDFALTQIIRAYINFNQNFIHVSSVSEMFRFLRRPGDVVVPFQPFLRSIILRALIYLADEFAIHRDYFLQLTQTLMLERYYSEFLEDLFDEYAEHLKSPDDQYPDRGAVCASWEQTPPPFVARLLDLHVSLWSPFYTQIYLGLV